MDENALALHAALCRPDREGYLRIQYLEIVPGLPQGRDNVLVLLVRLSTMASRVPPIFSNGLICRRTLATDPNNSFKPLVDR